LEHHRETKICKVREMRQYGSIKGTNLRVALDVDIVDCSMIGEVGFTGSAYRIWAHSAHSVITEV
jgi:hypothetical protein